MKNNLKTLIHLFLLICCLILSLAHNNEAFGKNNSFKKIKYHKHDKNKYTFLLNVDNQKFSITRYSNSDVCFYSKKWRIYEKALCPFGIFIKDMNNDGFDDVRFIQPFGDILYLYNPKFKRFENIIDFEKYPIVKNFSNSKYYYSSCTSSQYDLFSYLFIIENNRVVPIASVFVNNIEGDSEGICFYRESSKIKTEKQCLFSLSNNYYDSFWNTINNPKDSNAISNNLPDDDYPLTYDDLFLHWLWTQYFKYLEKF